MRAKQWAALGSVAFSPNGRLLASGSEDGTVNLWHVPSGRLLATLLILPSRQLVGIPPEQLTFARRMHWNQVSDHLEDAGSGDWLAYTPDGYFVGSTAAESFIRWRLGDTLLPAESYTNAFHMPDLVQKTLHVANPLPSEQ